MRDVIEEEVDEDEAEENVPTVFYLTPLIELRNFEDYGYEPLIDEPVTGAANEDLWSPADPSPNTSGNPVPPKPPPSE